MKSYLNPFSPNKYNELERTRKRRIKNQLFFDANRTLLPSIQNFLLPVSCNQGTNHVKTRRTMQLIARILPNQGMPSIISNVSKSQIYKILDDCQQVSYISSVNKRLPLAHFILLSRKG